MDPTSTGGLALDEEEAALRGSTIKDSILEVKKSHARQGNSGQLISKASEEDIDPRDVTLIEADTSRKRSGSVRHDRFGNPITTVIGSYSLSNVGKRSRSIKEKKDSLNASTLSGGTGEGQEKKEKKKRHRLTFMDEVTGDKTQLLEVHPIESYKKYNSEFYMEQQA